MVRGPRNRFEVAFAVAAFTLHNRGRYIHYKSPVYVYTTVWLNKWNANCEINIIADGILWSVCNWCRISNVYCETLERFCSDYEQWSETISILVWSGMLLLHSLLFFTCIFTGNIWYIEVREKQHKISKI